MYTIGTAAKATGKAKSVISRAIKDGKISAVKNEQGSYSIDPAELHRVYPPVSQSNSSSNPNGNGEQPPISSIGTGELEAEVEQLLERLRVTELERDRERHQLTDQIEDLRRRLDNEGEERRKLTAILTDQRPKPEAAPPPALEQPRKGLRGWLHRITG